MFRYRLRTLLILLASLPPLIGGVVHYHFRNWRALTVLRSLERVQVQRDSLLEAWRVAYDRVRAGQASADQEADIREQYYKALQEFKKEKAAIEDEYGSVKEARHLGAQAAIFER